MEENVMTMESVREKFNEYMGVNAKSLDWGTFKQVNEEYERDRIHICKHCQKAAMSGCCELYKNKDRTKKNMVRNMGFVHSII